MTFRPRRLPAPALLSALLLAGCSDDSDVLARVGRATITREDFLAAAQGGGLSYPGPPDSARIRLLEDLVRRELLVQGALGAGMHRDTAFLDQRGRLEEQMLRERLFRDLTGGAAPVSDAEIAEFHRWRGEESRIGIVYLLTEPMARRARAELDAGRPFEEVARRYNPAGALPPDGDLGYVAPGMLIEPVDGRVRTAKPGTLLGPIEAGGQGWFIVRVGDRRPTRQMPLEAARPQIVDMLRQRKQRAVMLRAIDGLKREYGMSLRPGGAQLLVARMSSPSPTLESLMRLPDLTESDRAAILARYRGGVYTMGDAMTDLNRADQQRPNFLMLPSVERWIEAMALERAGALEARRRRYQEEPELQRAVRQRSNNFLLDVYYTTQVLHGTTIDQNDLRARYAVHAGSLAQLEGARVLRVTLPDSAAAAQLIAHAGHAGTLREAAAMAAPEARVRDERVRYPTNDPLWGSFRQAFMRMVPGEYAGPQRTDSGWIVLQLVSKDQRTPRFEELPPAVLQHLEAEALEHAREARIMHLTDSLRRHIPVRVWAERLQRIPWPPAVPPARG